MEAWVVVEDLVGVEVALGVVEVVEEALTEAWVAVMETGSAPTRHVETTTSHGGYSATGVQHHATVQVDRVDLIMGGRLECEVACGAGLEEAVVVTVGVVEEAAQWVDVAVEAPWEVEDHPWVAAEVDLGQAVEALVVVDLCVVDLAGTEVTEEQGLTRKWPVKCFSPLAAFVAPLCLLTCINSTSCSSPSQIVCIKTFSRTILHVEHDVLLSHCVVFCKLCIIPQ